MRLFPKIRYATNEENERYRRATVQEGQKYSVQFSDYIACYKSKTNEIIINSERWTKRFFHAKIKTLLHELLHWLFGRIPGFNDGLDFWKYSFI